MEKTLETIWTVVNSGLGITLLASLVLYILNKIYSKKPAWSAFEGTIISAIRWAEKQSDGNKFDEALKLVIKVYEETTKKRASAKVQAELKEGINIIHNDLELSGALNKDKK